MAEKRKPSLFGEESCNAKKSNNKSNNSCVDTNLVSIDLSKQTALAYQELRGRTLADDECDIEFAAEDRMFKSHSQVLHIFANKLRYVRDSIDGDKQMFGQRNLPQPTRFVMRGTTGDAFAALLNYLYTGRVSCGQKCAIDLAITAVRMKFEPLVAAIAQQLTDIVLSAQNVDDVYYIAKNGKVSALVEKCAHYMDEKAALINETHLKVDENCNDANTIALAFDTTQHANYIHFKIDGEKHICFYIEVSSNRRKWTKVVDNELIESMAWNWFYFKEERVRYIRITSTETLDKSIIDRSHILVKRVNRELTFLNDYLVPKHDAVQYPLKDTKHQFGGGNYTYCLSAVSDKLIREKFNTQYYYHNVGDNDWLEFYLPQTCWIDAIRFRLWDHDDRRHDFEVRVKDEDNDWQLIGTYNDRQSWQTISFEQYYRVRWISITGLVIKGVADDNEFAITHFECPPQLST